MSETVELIKEINSLIIEEREKHDLELFEKNSIIDDLKAENDNLKLDIDNLTKVIEGLKAKTLGTVKRMNEYSETLENKVTDLESKLADSSSKTVEIASLKSEIENIRAESHKSREILNYKFGKTSKEVMAKALNFIAGLYHSAPYTNGVYTLNDPQVSKANAEINDREFEIFMNRLALVTVNGKKFIENNNGVLTTTFDEKYIKEYLTQINTKS